MTRHNQQLTHWLRSLEEYLPRIAIDGDFTNVLAYYFDGASLSETAIAVSLAYPY